jgi:hypothetical protein
MNLQPIKNLVELYPRLYLAILRVKRRKHWSRMWLVTRDTDLVVEGFPRSANSFTFHAIRDSQPRELKIATHTHSATQVIVAVRWGIPCMILLRDPIDAVVGIISFERQLQLRSGTAVQPVTPGEIKTQLKRWVLFYERILPVRDSVFIARFDDVIRDFENVSKRFSHYAGGRCEPWHPEKRSADELLGDSFHIGPDSERDLIKASVREQAQAISRTYLGKRAADIFRQLGKD